MKKLTMLFSALCLTMALTVPASALEYNINAPDDPEYGKSTSVEPVYTADRGEMPNVDVSKNAALVPPTFGSASAYTLNTGFPLTPNLAPGYMLGEGAAINGSAGITVAPPDFNSIPSDIVSNVSTSTVSTTTSPSFTSYTEVTSDLYYSGGYLATLKIPSLNVNVKVYQGTGSSILAKGAGHFEDTTIWNGNCCKLALDQRLLNPLLPDSETGKVNACAENVFEIWQRTAEQRSTQMVFCDLSIPKGNGDFNVYDDLRDKLIAKGIPAEEIAYIHSANSEAQKKELFGKVRSGQIRVLLGSTQKMGAGTNVQQKLVALHHLDCPWRPSDLQQREGRIIRQGNENPEVDIYTYVTENTFDSYLYQLVEGKQKFIGQIMTSKSPVRSAEDIDETALSYAEIKALCTGNPYIKEKMDLDIDVQRLKLLKANHLSQRYALEDQIIKKFPRDIAIYEELIAGYAADMDRLKENTHPNEDGFSPMEVEGVVYTDKKAAGSAILAACQAMTSPNPVHLGQYRGFDMELSFESFTKEYQIALRGELNHKTSLGTDIFGNILRLDNLLGGMQERQIYYQEQLENVNVQLANAKQEVEKPFPKEEELRTKSARLDELNILLNMDKRDSEIVDGEPDEDAPSPARDTSDRER